MISGSARNKETLDWLEKLFGKVRQLRSGLSIDQARTSVSMNEYMGNLIPASKIANLKAGKIVAQIGRESDNSNRDKGDFALELQSILTDVEGFEVPDYTEDAVNWVVKIEKNVQQVN